jgi:hypothetical protein
VRFSPAVRGKMIREVRRNGGRSTTLAVCINLDAVARSLCPCGRFRGVHGTKSGSVGSLLAFYSSHNLAPHCPDNRRGCSSCLRAPHWTLLGYCVDAGAIPPRFGLHIHTVSSDGDIVDDSGYLRAFGRPR